MGKFNRVENGKNNDRPQLAIRLLRLAPTPYSSRWRGRTPKKVYDRITRPIRYFLSTRINTTLGPSFFAWSKRCPLMPSRDRKNGWQALITPFNPKGTYP